MWRIGILSCSDRGFRGEREDRSKDIIAKIASEQFGGEVVSYKCVPDELDFIKEALLDMIDQEKTDIIFTTGGTGLSPRDVTPEATMQVIDRSIPGFAEEMRRISMQTSREAIFTRAIIGTRGETLIVNLPGSPRATELCLRSIVDQIPEAIHLLKGQGHKVT